ncbi:MAG TPA: hypothetical protein VE826_12565 [Dongiaceae bacterium]|nr:hypothetical protein [Dongiaceae bacterium]
MADAVEPSERGLERRDRAGMVEAVKCERVGQDEAMNVPGGVAFGDGLQQRFGLAAARGDAGRAQDCRVVALLAVATGADGALENGHGPFVIGGDAQRTSQGGGRG